eukprot:1805142-Pyramimonas_sp.AAC.1
MRDEDAGGGLSNEARRPDNVPQIDGRGGGQTSQDASRLVLASLTNGPVNLAVARLVVCSM